ncbi:ATP-binding protein [Streptomyces griseorubiginosus]|uniref:ATP-binding protein n=1 Tax=Streptomyces griseorubiginosus TaxID=67304 RepID=UPI002E81C941|nr:ATP-binding protein [Streptomyces griseorubiginosus]WUB44631.1 ATP-binding protein [Streptomyces griseorubiginosus]WUB53148.1 ATP-binding protein [Streptomyces griseorubiginosus]
MSLVSATWALGQRSGTALLWGQGAHCVCELRAERRVDDPHAGFLPRDATDLEPGQGHVRDDRDGRPYGDMLHSASRFPLTLSAAHGVLRCEVADHGRRTPRVLDAGTSESGRGMFLVAALALCWGCLQDGPGKTVWCELGTRGTRGCGGRAPGGV